MLSDEPALRAWLAAGVLEPLGCTWRFVPTVPEAPEADVAVLALGTALSREEAAPRLARSWGIPVVALLGRFVENEEALVGAGVLPLRWPYSPLQIQEALLSAIGVGAEGRKLPAPAAPRIRRGKDRRPKPEN